MTDEDSPVDPADQDIDESGKGKAKMEEAAEGVYPLRVFMGRLVRNCCSLGRGRTANGRVDSGSVWQSATNDPKIYRQGTEILWKYLDGKRNELADGGSNTGALGLVCCRKSQD